MIKAIIIDDEPASLELLGAYIVQFKADVTVCAKCSSMQEGIAAIAKHDPQILLLDIKLGDGLGFEILEKFPGLQAHVVFITAYDQYVLKAIKVHAFDYLLKPVVKSEFEKTIQSVISNIKNTKPIPDTASFISSLKDKLGHKIAVPSRNGLIYYRTTDILYIKADGSYSVMHLDKGKTSTISRKIKDFEDSLENHGFIRVHKSYLINLHHVAELHRDESGYVLMDDGSRIPLSPKDKENVIQKIKMASHLI